MTEKLKRPGQRVQMGIVRKKRMQGQRAWAMLAVETLLAVFFYTFMEWLFFVTKPSFMDVMGLGTKISILFSTSFLVNFLGLLPLLLLFALNWLFSPARAQRGILSLAAGISAVFLSVTSLLLIDNFTYTIFKYGIISTTGAARAAYGLGFFVLLLLWWRWMARRTSHRLEKPVPQVRFSRLGIASLIMLVISLFFLLAQMDFSSVLSAQVVAGTQVKRPNIILLGSDGMNAANLSVYGYSRDTTPNLRRLAQRTLFAENAFTNSGNTSGSIVSILSSKPPTRNHLIYPPDILRGKDAFQHLPGILRSLGYTNVEISFPHYADAYNLNVQNGFDRVNDRSVNQEGIFAITRLSFLSDAGYFLSILAERVTDRLFHIFFIRQMANPYQAVTSKMVNIGDRARIDDLENIIRTSKQPFFVHVHMMGTHGSRFQIPKDKQVFSAGEVENANWMPDFYDDAILTYDQLVNEVWNVLEETGQLDNTILILYTDHNEQFVTGDRIPLMIHFPQDEYAGRLRANVQNMDIAPTVLSYMNMSIPDWMEGKSLITGDVQPDRLIFSTGVVALVHGEDRVFIDETRAVPPFYQFKYLRVITCQKWYLAGLDQFDWQSGDVLNHTAPCAADTLPAPAEIRAAMLQRLASDGFDVSTLKDYFATLP
jgi:hypothetical protein